MSTTPTTPVITTISRDAIEGRLGFTPEESVVLACASEDHEGLVIRLNLVDLTDEPQRGDLLARLARPMRQGDTSAVAVWYFTTTSPCILKPIDAAIDEFLVDLGVPRLVTRLVDAPPTGTRREDLGVIEPDSEDRRQQAHKAILVGEPDDGLAVYLSALSFARHGVPIPPALLGKAAAWMHASKGARDAVVILITGGTHHDANSLARGGLTWEADQAAGQAMDAILDEERGITPGLGVLDHSRLLAHIVAAVPPAYQVAPRTLLGMISYWNGDGALADRHCAEALKIDRTYIFASQIRALQALGVPPGWVHAHTA